MKIKFSLIILFCALIYTSLFTMKAVKQVTAYLGMQAAERSEEVGEKKKKHILYLSGLFVGDVSVLCRARMLLDKGGNGVQLELTVRSSNENVSALLAAAVG